MTMVTQYNWEDDTFMHRPDTTRQLWRETVAEIADKAKATLPECTTRVERAVALVLAGDVELVEDGTARVASQRQGRTQYLVVNGTCECRDYTDQKAPRQLCKHRLAAAIVRRAQEHVQAQQHGARNGQVAAAPDPAPTLPEAEASAFPTPGIPPQHIVMIQGRPFVKFAGLLQMAHERGLVALTADWTYNDAELSLAHAVATFQDGRRFEEAGDATPANTNRKVAVHFRRVALTRAKARALRDALGVDLVAVEELADSE